MTPVLVEYSKSSASSGNTSGWMAWAAMAASAALEREGFLVTAIRPPTVPEGTARLRITLTAAHEASDIDHLLEALASITRCQEPV